MDSYDFYVLVRRLENAASTEFLNEAGSRLGDGPRCDQCGEFVGSRNWLPPHRVELETWGEHYGDLVVGPGPQLIVSSQFAQIYNDSELKGLSGFDHVEIVNVINHRKLRESIPQYRKVNVSRGETALDAIASGVEWDNEPVCSRCLIGQRLKRRQRIVIDKNTWTGDDIFFARGLPGEYIVSARFKQVCEAHQVKNAFFVPSVHRR